jgi:phosphoribosylaminoimidazolecarboxamide formyltransferase/IMP cyclohydrolase
MNSPSIRRAIISVSDKSGLSELARGLVAAGIQIYSTGGTRRHLEEEGLEVHDVAKYTGFPEMMDGRVKTLHPRIFAGILCRHNHDDDMQSLEEHDIASFELVVVNLYPFQQTIAHPDVTREEAIEQIDIGGPSLVRAAAKNHAFVSILTSPGQYADALKEIKADGSTSLALRQRLAAEAFESTACYDRAIADYFVKETGEDVFPGSMTISLQRKAILRYGENPHQQAALYGRPDQPLAGLVHASQLNGKELSYNNLLDLDSAQQIVCSFQQPAVSVIKHNNPCGAAVADELVVAASKAMAGDPLSAFGSVLGFNRAVDAATAEILAEPGLFIEAIVAPGFDEDALEILTTVPKWKNNVRLMQVEECGPPEARLQPRHIDGGLLLQTADVLPDEPDQWEVVTTGEPDESLLAELRFAWQIVRHIKSNAIALCRDQSLVGVGAGQMSRVDSVEIAINKADDRVQGAVLSSDAFFPFSDSIHRAADAGVSAIIQPGGSRRDDEVIAACNERGLPMVFTGKRHFKH